MPLDQTSPDAGSASERIHQYIMKEFGSLKSGENVRLPPIRTLAKHLNVSTATVFHVYKTLSQEGLISREVGRGTFWKPKAVQKSKHRSIRIALNYESVSARSPWAYELHLAIMEAAGRSKRRVSLVPLPSESEDPEILFAMLREEKDEVDAVIFFPRGELPPTRMQELIGMYEEKGLPLVSILPPQINATSNFVSPDYFLAGQTLGRVFGRSGRRRLSYLMAKGFPSLSPNTLLIMAGLQSGMNMEGVTQFPVQVLWTEDSTESAGAAAGEALLKSSHADLPDVVVCDGDYHAIGLAKSLRKAGIRIPEDLSIVGGTGLDFPDSEWSALARLRQPFKEVGKEVVRLIIESLDSGNPRFPGRYLPIPIVGGSTVTMEENLLLSELLA